MNQIKTVISGILVTGVVCISIVVESNAPSQAS